MSIIPGDTILILLGAISGAMPLAKASTAPPTDEIAIWSQIDNKKALEIMKEP